MQVLQSQAGPLAQLHVWGWLPGARGDVPCRAGAPIRHGGGGPNPLLQALCCNVGTMVRKTEAQDIPLLLWHKLGSEKQYSAENWEPQLSLSASAGKHVELQAKEGRKWDYLKPPILKGMATNSDLWPKYHCWLFIVGLLRDRMGPIPPPRSADVRQAEQGLL